MSATRDRARRLQDRLHPRARAETLVDLDNALAEWSTLLASLPPEALADLIAFTTREFVAAGLLLASDPHTEPARESA